MKRALGSIGFGFGVVFIFALLLPLAVVQQGCEARGGREIGPRQAAPRLQVFWSSEKVSLEYQIKNTTSEAMEFEFRNSGRVCGVIGDAAGKEIYSFPQITAQVMGAESLAPGEELTFRHAVLAETLGALPPGTYPVEAWLCGYPKLRAQVDFEIPPEN